MVLGSSHKGKRPINLPYLYIHQSLATGFPIEEPHLPGNPAPVKGNSQGVRSKLLSRQYSQKLEKTRRILKGQISTETSLQVSLLMSMIAASTSSQFLIILTSLSTKINMHFLIDTSRQKFFFFLES